MAFFSELEQLVDDTPPLPQPMRFGNIAFRTWIDAMREQTRSRLRDILFSDLTPNEMSEEGNEGEFSEFFFIFFVFRF